MNGQYNEPKLIVMLGVHPHSKHHGGVYEVIEIYRRGGLFARWPIVYIGTVASGGSLTKIRIAAAALWSYLRVLSTRRVTLVHVHTASRASFWRKSVFMLIALAARRKVILHLHGAEFATFYTHECGRLRQWLIRFVLDRVDSVVVLSSQWKTLISEIAPTANVSKIFNPVPAPALHGVRRLDNVLLFLGRFGQRKGVFDLLEALTAIRVRFPGIKLWCGGDGDREAVQTRVRELGLCDCVEVLGWVSGREKEQVLAEATIYVAPSHAEGLPMGVLEAMAAGAPIVATTAGGIPDAVEDGVEGFLVAPLDTDALADRIIRLLENPELRSAFAAAASRKAREQFGIETVLARVEALYASLGALPRNPPTRNHGVNEGGEARKGAPA
ncbi:MAG TPA: glycosyltransferase family 4 protein [Steroidobacter sp.]|nr:glycosyltransferase family 4 protein [Steroidobacter sp.]